MARSAQPPEPIQISRDQVLMETVAAGDRNRFRHSGAAESPRLLRFARSLIAPAEAEEVVQEALLRLWQQAETWQPQGRVSTWLHQVAYRLCIDRLRRRRPSVGIEEVQDDLEDPAPGAGSASSARCRGGCGTSRDRGTARAAARRDPALSLPGVDPGRGIAGDGDRRGGLESLLARGRRRLRLLLAENSDLGGTP